MGHRCGHIPRLLRVPEVPVLTGCRHSAWALGAGCPQRDSNPRYHLERVATWAASRWGRPSEDTGGQSYHPWPPGRLAQLVERLPYTQVAAGSSPAPPICRPGDMRNPHGGGGQLCAVTPPSRRRALVCLEASFGDRAMMCSFVRGHRMLGTRRSVRSPTRHLRHTCDKPCLRTAAPGRKHKTCGASSVRRSWAAG